MRQVFTSPRLENVEGVARLLREHQIEVKITNGRTYRGAIRGNFSYREPPDRSEQPAVWVVRSDDQPKARELLREAGLLDSGRSPTSYLATPTVHQLRGDDGAGDAARRRAFRFKAALFVGIAAALGMTLLSLRTPSTMPRPAVAAVATPPTSANAAATGAADAPPDTYPVTTPKALAALLVNAELAAQSEMRAVSRVCVSIDGAAPSPSQIDALRLPKGVRVRPAPDCAATALETDALHVAIGPYLTDGSGVGTVRIQIVDRGRNGALRRDARTLEVARDDVRWRVLRVLP